MHEKKKIALIPVGLCALLWFVQANAHHSFVAEFDKTAALDIDGWVTKIDWLNPHVHVFLDVKDQSSGKTTQWDIEMGPPYLLARTGWTRTSMKIGDEVRVVGYRARDGRLYGNARVVTLVASGKQLLAGSSADKSDKDAK